MSKMKLNFKTFPVVFGSYEQFVAFRNQLMNYTQEDFKSEFPALFLLATNEDNYGDYPMYIGYIMAHTTIDDKEHKYVIISKENNNV